MSENSELIATEQKINGQLSHTRILWLMVIVIIAGAIASLIFVSARFASSFVLGGIAAFVNYFWLKNSLKKVFDATASGARPSFLSLNYFLRYLAFGLFVYIVYLTNWVSMIAFLLGAGVFAAAIVIEGLILILSSISKREEV